MFGAIKRIVLPQDAHQIGSNRGFTFITFASKEPVEVACSLGKTFTTLWVRRQRAITNFKLRWDITPRAINKGCTKD